MNQPPEEPRTQPVRPRCHLPWQEMVIQADGTVEPCCYWTAHGNANDPLGNINEASIAEIWNGKGYQRLRAHMAADNLQSAGCANCFALRQGQTLALEYDKDCEKPEFAATPYADNIRRLKREIAAGATRPEAKPTILSVTASHKCNLACLHCYQNASRTRQWEREDAFAEIEALVPTLVRLIAGGGEPLLLSRWRRFIAEFSPERAPLLNFAMTTNATVIKPEVLEGLKRFKSLHIIVSMDGANADVYQKIRVNGNFAEVEKNIRVLHDAVLSRPNTDVTTFGLCMSVMKSNIRHLPDFVRWAARKGLLFSMHPVLQLPLTESLVSFNDPLREMQGWREAIDEARRLVRTLDADTLPPLWRATQQLSGAAVRNAWPFFDALESFIPWDIGYTRHNRFVLDLPARPLARARARWPNRPLVVSMVPSAPVAWHAGARPYHARLVDSGIAASLPSGVYHVVIDEEFEIADGVPVGLMEVTPRSARFVAGVTAFHEHLRSFLHLDAARHTPGSPHPSSSEMDVRGHQVVHLH